MREEVNDMKKELEEIKEQSFAMELLRDYKEQNKRWLICWLITFAGLIGMVAYSIYLLNDIDAVETTTTEETHDQTIESIGSISDSTISNGGAR